MDVGPSKETTFWLGFLRSLVARGLSSVQLVISDAHLGMQAALGAVLHGAEWQRCRVHWLRNALSLVEIRPYAGGRHDPHHLQPI